MILCVGAVLLLARLSQSDMGAIVTVGGTYAMVEMLSHILVGTSPQMQMWLRVWAKHWRGQKWRRFMEMMCATTLALSEAVRGSGLTLCPVLLACVLAGSGGKQRQPWMPPKVLRMLLNLSAATCLIAFSVMTEGLQWRFFDTYANATDYVWLFLAMDYVWSQGLYAVVVAALVRADRVGTWPFMCFVFPCMCVWQRRECMRFRKVMYMTFKPEGIVYCFACIGAVALCAAVYAPCAQALLGTHFALRVFGLGSGVWKHVRQRRA